MTNDKMTNDKIIKIDNRSDTMNIDELTKRINFLYKKSKEEGLTEEEKIEQQELRQRYIDNVKRNFRSQLDTIKVVEPGDQVREGDNKAKMPYKH